MRNSMKPIITTEKQLEAILRVLTQFGLSTSDTKEFSRSILDTASYGNNYNTFEWSERGFGIRFLVTPLRDGSLTVEVVQNGHFCSYTPEEIDAANRTLSNGS